MRNLHNTERNEEESQTQLKFHYFVNLLLLSFHLYFFWGEEEKRGSEGKRKGRYYDHCSATCF